MPMSPYPVRCYAAGCDGPAAYKVAARWSDGVTHELKTYSLACAACLPGLFADAVRRRAACRLTVGETADEVGVYDLSRGERDKGLRRRPELEAGFPSPG